MDWPTERIGEWAVPEWRGESTLCDNCLPEDQWRIVTPSGELSRMPRGLLPRLLREFLSRLDAGAPTVADLCRALWPGEWEEIQDRGGGDAAKAGANEANRKRMESRLRAHCSRLAALLGTPRIMGFSSLIKPGGTVLDVKDGSLSRSEKEIISRVRHFDASGCIWLDQWDIPSAWDIVPETTPEFVRARGMENPKADGLTPFAVRGRSGTYDQLIQQATERGPDPNRANPHQIQARKALLDEILTRLAGGERVISLSGRPEMGLRALQRAVGSRALTELKWTPYFIDCSQRSREAVSDYVTRQISKPPGSPESAQHGPRPVSSDLILLFHTARDDEEVTEYLRSIPPGSGIRVLRARSDRGGSPPQEEMTEIGPLGVDEAMSFVERLCLDRLGRRPSAAESDKIRKVVEDLAGEADPSEGALTPDAINQWVGDDFLSDGQFSRKAENTRVAFAPNLRDDADRIGNELQRTVRETELRRVLTELGVFEQAPFTLAEARSICPDQRDLIDADSFAGCLNESSEQPGSETAFDLRPPIREALEDGADITDLKKPRQRLLELIVKRFEVVREAADITTIRRKARAAHQARPETPSLLGRQSGLKATEQVRLAVATADFWRNEPSMSKIGKELIGRLVPHAKGPDRACLWSILAEIHRVPSPDFDNDPDKARSFANKVIESTDARPADRGSAYYSRAMIDYWTDAEASGADDQLEDLSKAYATAPELKSRVETEKGWNRLKQSRFPEAIKHFESANNGQGGSDQAEAIEGLIQATWRTGKIARAWQHYAQAAPLVAAGSGSRVELRIEIAYVDLLRCDRNFLGAFWVLQNRLTGMTEREGQRWKAKYLVNRSRVLLAISESALDRSVIRELRVAEILPLQDGDEIGSTEELAEAILGRAREDALEAEEMLQQSSRPLWMISHDRYLAGRLMESTARFKSGDEKRKLLEQAVSEFEVSLNYAENQPWSRARSANWLSDLLRRLGRFQPSRTAIQQAISAQKEMSGHGEEVVCPNVLAKTLEVAADLAQDQLGVSEKQCRNLLGKAAKLRRSVGPDRRGGPSRISLEIALREASELLGHEPAPGSTSVAGPSSPPSEEVTAKNSRDASQARTVGRPERQASLSHLGPESILIDEIADIHPGPRGDLRLVVDQPDEIRGIRGLFSLGPEEDPQLTTVGDVPDLASLFGRQVDRLIADEYGLLLFLPVGVSPSLPPPDPALPALGSLGLPAIIRPELGLIAATLTSIQIKEAEDLLSISVEFDEIVALAIKSQSKS
jgi:tetratricopeptide (TPR) repeat protein